jgi:hypothetical protein
MSTDLVSMKQILVRDLFDGRLASYGIHGAADERGYGCLRDEFGTVEVFSSNGTCDLFLYRGLAGVHIMAAIAEHFDTSFAAYDEVYQESMEAARNGEEITMEELFMRISKRRAQR